jgi:hypothetical protein
MRLLFVLIVISYQCIAVSSPLFTTDSETEPPNKVAPPKGLIEFILKGEDANDNRLLAECLEEKGFTKKQASIFFSIYKIDLNSDGLPDYFVRPALKPYCFAFYGAHLFRYWLVTAQMKNGQHIYYVAFKNGGDGVSILPTKTNGYRDLLVVGYNAVEEHQVTLAFDGNEYQTKSCVKNMFSEEGVKTGPCESAPNPAVNWTAEQQTSSPQAWQRRGQLPSR